MRFLTQLKENEREKMQIWAAAQTELQNDKKDAVISETALEVIKSNTTTPMLVYSHKEGVYTERNIKKKRVETAKQKEKLVAQFSSEYKPIEIRYGKELLGHHLLWKFSYYQQTEILSCSLDPYSVSIYCSDLFVLSNFNILSTKQIMGWNGKRNSSSNRNSFVFARGLGRNFKN